MWGERCEVWDVRCERSVRCERCEKCERCGRVYVIIALYKVTDVVNDITAVCLQDYMKLG